MTAAAGVDFFQSGSLPAPLVSQAEAERIAAGQFGLTARARSLGSQQDSNFLLTASDGTASNSTASDGMFSDGTDPDNPVSDGLVLGAGAEPCSTVPAIRAFQQVRPLSFEEAAVLWPLVVLRAAVLVVSGEQQAAIDTGNAYVTGALDHERQMFAQAIAVPADVMTALILDDLGFGHPPLRVPYGSALRLGRCEILDLSSQSDATDAGTWMEPGLADRLAAALLAEAGPTGVDAVATRFGEARLTASQVLTDVSPATVATGVDVWLGQPAELTAPWAGELTSDARDQLVLTGSGLALTLCWNGSGAETAGREVAGPEMAGLEVAAGAKLVTLAAGSLLRVNLRAATAPPMPSLVRPEYAGGWLALATDPAPALGLPPALARPAVRGAREEDLLARRDKSVAAVQELYYRDPPRIERG